MTSVNTVTFSQRLREYLREAVQGREVINVKTEDGDAVLLSREEYSGLLETLYLTRHPETAKEILEAMSEDWTEGEVYQPEAEW